MPIIPINEVLGLFSRDFMDPFEGLIASGFAGVDHEETCDAHIYKIRILNFNSEDVKIQMEDRKYVRIIAEKKGRREDKGKNSYVMESSSSGYYCRFCLPENANVNTIIASMENNGVVTIVVPKN